MKYAVDWRERASCRDADPELFFPVTEVGPGAEEVTRAKSICAGCPVRTECLKYAVDSGLDYGIFGGATPTERRQLTRQGGQTQHVGNGRAA